MSKIKTIEPNVPEFVMPHAGRRYLLKGRQTFVQIVYIGVWINSVCAAHVRGLNKRNENNQLLTKTTTTHTQSGEREIESQMHLGFCGSGNATSRFV